MYKTIVVLIDGGPRQDSRLRAAAFLANACGAHLVGSAATGISPVESSLLSGSMAALRRGQKAPYLARALCSFR